MIAVIDYGAGNLRSVMHALRHLKAEDVLLVQHGRELAGADKIILPGVGAFGAGMAQLGKQDMVGPLKEALLAGVPYLGICLGMQFLFEYSDEMGQHAGLGVLPGRVTRFPVDHPHKVPHMGWNQLQVARDNPLTAGLPDAPYAYFVHSYYCEPVNTDDVIITADYGMRFAAAVQRGNIFGVQFHPEKSQATGLTLLRTFLAYDPVRSAPDRV
jgi:glutamine amidotransferase